MVRTSAEYERSLPFGPATRHLMPVQIREDLTIFIQGLPHDLTTQEARRISAVVMAFAEEERAKDDR